MLTLWNASPLFSDRVFNDMMRPFSASGWQPMFEVDYEDDRTVITADVPGLKTEDLDVSVAERVLTISGSRKGRGGFKKLYSLSEHADVDGLQARLEDGVLTVTVPKTPKAQPRKIPVRASTEG